MRALSAHEEGLHMTPIPSQHFDVTKSGRRPPAFHPGGAHQGGPLGRHPEDSDLGSRRYPGGIIRPPNSEKEPITTPQQLVRGVQVCVRIRSH